MVVQHNMQAANASRMLNITANAQAKSTEKLSSGYRINRAADDAAGLSISEKMRKQIRGLDQASTNAEDGVSAVQTAEGALTEVHSMLQRMNELAVQASNGTNSESDRSAIQSEIDQLTTEIDRVAETTKFNETYLLKGNGSDKTMTLNAHDAGLSGVTFGEVNPDDGTVSITFDGTWTEGNTKTIGGKEYQIVADTAVDVVPDQVDAKDVTDAEKIAAASKINKAQAKILAGKEIALASSVGADKDTQAELDDDDAPTKLTLGKVTTKNALTFNLHVGSDADMTNKINVNIERMDSAYLGIKDLNVSDDSGKAATYAIDAISDALQKVSDQRSSLGAIQNRLEHTIDNLDNVVENTTSAESRIRDTDMADEMVKYSKNNILTQAGQSMLAQANQSTQGVLSLLQ